jgi:predicted HicB family RNase H-like nuclease
MPRPPTDSPDIKVRVTPNVKAAFVEAAEKARQSLTQWMIQAGEERVARQGVKIKPEKKGGQQK